jgi:hypothetical protein
MKNKWSIMLLVVLIMVGGWGVKIIITEISAASNFELPQINSISEEVKSSPKEDESDREKPLERVDSQNVVTIKSTLVPDRSDLTSKLVFDIKMDTHSVDLSSIDLKTLSEISIDSIVAEGRFFWEIYKKDSHHVSGTLIWDGKGPIEFSNLTLTLKNINEIPERTFSWQVNEITK